LHEEQVLKSSAFREQLDFLLNCPYIRLKASNFKYDTHWLAVRAGFQCSTFTFDTVLVGSLLDENRSNALDVHVKSTSRHLAATPMSLIGRLIRHGWISCHQISYCLTLVAMWMVISKLPRREQILLQDPQLTSFYVNILHPAARAFEQIEQTGALIDKDAYSGVEVRSRDGAYSARERSQ